MKKLWLLFHIILWTLIILGCFFAYMNKANADIHGAVAAIETTVDYKASTDEDDLSVDQVYLAGWYGNTDGYIYGSAEEIQEEFEWVDEYGQRQTSIKNTNRIIVEEVYGKLYFYDLKWKIGKVILPFGFEYLSRPQSSVFITRPKEDFFDFGLHLGAEYGIVKLDGSYIGKGNYSIRGTLSLFDGMNQVSFGINDIPEIKERFGRFSITNMFKYGSTFLDVSNLIDYNPDTGDFWTRLVVAPGMFDSVGIFGAYYHLDEIYNGLHDFEHSPNSWTYGAFLDFSPNMYVSVEWINSNFLNPLTFQLTILF